MVVEIESVKYVGSRETPFARRNLLPVNVETKASDCLHLLFLKYTRWYEVNTDSTDEAEVEMQ